MIERELLHAYVDGELSPAEKTQFEAALKQDPTAAEQLSAVRQLKAFTAQHARPVENDELWQTCVGRLGELDKSKRIEGFVGKYAWGLCALFFCVIFAGGMLRHLNPNSVRTGQVASYVSGLAGGWSRPPVESATRREWVEQKLGAMSAAVQPQFTIQACQEGYVDEHHLTRLLLNDGRGPLELVVVSGIDSIEGGEMLDRYHMGTLNGANCIAWSQGGKGVFLLGNAAQRTHQDLAEIASNLGLR